MTWNGTPYKMAKRAPIRLPRLPRRSRVLLVVVVLFWATMFLTMPRVYIGRALYFFAFSPGGVGRAASLRPLSKGDILDFVDPLIGTMNGGHVFPGATLPYGMAKAVADVHHPPENAAGYVTSDRAVIGFSQLHDSGTGGSPSLGNFPLFVNPGCIDDDFHNCRFMREKRQTMRVKDSAKASPGYFSLELNNSVRAEMTTTDHTVLYRFSFSGRPTVQTRFGVVPYSPLIMVDTSDLAQSRVGGAVRIDPATGRIVGQGHFNPSFGIGRYHAYFCADFAGANIRQTGTFVGDTSSADSDILNGTGHGYYLPHGSAGGWIHFEPPPTNQILARVGLSFISFDQACQNAEREIPDFDFESVVESARDAWRQKLGVIEVDPHGVSKELLTTFWSGLYRTFLSPQNYTGENPLWSSTEPYFDSFYCIWDSFRAQHPLLTIIDPVAQTEIVRALIDIYRYAKKLPDCRMSFCKGYTQGGSNADVVITDAWLKNITDGIDWDTAYEAVVSDAEIEPKNWNVEGRGNLDSWHDLGYIAWDDIDSRGSGTKGRTISRGLEYAYDDFCISTLARGLGHNDDAQKYLKRSGNWKNYWKSNQRDLHRVGKHNVVASNFTGFPQPRLKNGTFRYHITRLCSPVENFHGCYLDTKYDTYEGSPWLYAFFVLQDMSALVRTMGGKKTFVDRLSYFHTSGIGYIGNEQAFLPVFQFHYASRPGLSSFWAHQYIPSQFNASINGIPGNDDCAMGAFSAFALMGFFPVAGQDVYLLTAPFFREVRIATKTGGTAVIKVTNFDPSYRAIYIQSARLNGKPYHRNWIRHSFFVDGGVLELKVGRQESDWGTLDQDLPPSYPYYDSG